ncbi:MAG: hypothetical protein PHF84_04025 [bacterium]|nr:hypothetical protein [bacterium]
MKIKLFIIVILVFSASFAFAAVGGKANKVVAVSGFENNDETSIMNKWVDPLESQGVFEKNGYKHVEKMSLPNNGRDSMRNDIKKLAKTINNELVKDGQNITGVDLVGHSKGGVCIENFSAVIANPDSEIYKELKESGECDELLARWNSDKMFVENVVPVSAPMDGTYKSIQNFVKSDDLLAKAARNKATKDEHGMKIINEGMLSLAKANDDVDYLNSLKPGPSRKVYLVSNYDPIVPSASAYKANQGYTEFVKGSSGHSSIFNPKNPDAVDAIFRGLKSDPNDKSDYNNPKVSWKTKAKDMAIDGIVNTVTLPGKVAGTTVSVAAKIIKAPFVLAGKIFKGIGSFFSKKESNQKGSTVASGTSGADSTGGSSGGASGQKGNGIEWTSLGDIEREYLGE